MKKSMSDEKKQIEEKRDPSYLKYISSKVSDDLYEQIIRILHIEKNIETNIIQQKNLQKS